MELSGQDETENRKDARVKSWRKEYYLAAISIRSAEIPRHARNARQLIEPDASIASLPSFTRHTFAVIRLKVTKQSLEHFFILLRFIPISKVPDMLGYHVCFAMMIPSVEDVII